MSKEYSLGSVMNKYAQKVFAHIHAHRVRLCLASLFVIATFIFQSQEEEVTSAYGYLFAFGLLGFYLEIWHLFSFIAFALFYQWRHFDITLKSEVERLTCFVCSATPAVRLQLSLTHAEKLRRIEQSSQGRFTAGLGVEIDIPDLCTCGDHHPIRGKKKHETFRCLHSINPEFEIDQILPLQDE